MKQVQALVGKFITKNELEADASARLLDVTSELGELSKEYLKSTDYAMVDFRATQSCEQEFGDVFFALLCLANETVIDLSEALEQTLSKYPRRLRAGGTAAPKTQTT